MAVPTTTTAIFGAIGIVGLIALFIVLMKIKKKASVPELEKKAEELTKDELKLKQLLDKKENIRGQAKTSAVKHNAYQVKDRVEQIEDTVDMQEQLVHNITKIDKKSLNALRHLGIQIRFAGAPHMHVTEFMKEIKKAWKDIDSQHAREAKLKEIKQDPDGVSRNVKYAALTMVLLKVQYDKFRSLYKNQRGILKKIRFASDKLKKKKVELKDYSRISDLLMKLASRTSYEKSEIDRIIELTKRLRFYLKELESAESLKYRPFLVVEGHPVDIVTDSASGKTVPVGKHEKISLPFFNTKRITFSRHARSGHIVLHKDAADPHAVIRKNGNYFLFAESNAPTFVVSKSPRRAMALVNSKSEQQNLVNEIKSGKYTFLKRYTGPRQATLFTKVEKLNYGDEIILGNNRYRFRFAQN
ncbi:hypothetical protein KY349_04665 [Candidatus Woesearchaeota archaeon]|nr:hypothetical protein [Candidatus Woesearchaeota archaeon]